MGEITLTPITNLDKIVNKSIERIRVHMPRYHSLPDNWKGRGKFSIRASKIPRSFWPFSTILPYHVGDRVRFIVKFEFENPKDHLSNVIFENFRGSFKALEDVNGISKEIIGNIIDGEGDIGYYLGTPSNAPESKPIFTTRVESWDTVLSKWSWTIVGAIITLLCVFLSWLLGIIQIAPTWIAQFKP